MTLTNEQLIELIRESEYYFSALKKNLEETKKELLNYDLMNSFQKKQEFFSSLPTSEKDKSSEENFSNFWQPREIFFFKIASLSIEYVHHPRFTYSAANNFFFAKEETKQVLSWENNQNLTSIQKWALESVQKLDRYRKEQTSELYEKNEQELKSVKYSEKKLKEFVSDDHILGFLDPSTKDPFLNSLLSENSPNENLLLLQGAEKVWIDNILNPVSSVSSFFNLVVVWWKILKEESKLEEKGYSKKSLFYRTFFLAWLKTKYELTKDLFSNSDYQKNIGGAFQHVYSFGEDLPQEEVERQKKEKENLLTALKSFIQSIQDFITSVEQKKQLKESYWFNPKSDRTSWIHELKFDDGMMTNATKERVQARNYSFLLDAYFVGFYDVLSTEEEKWNFYQIWGTDCFDRFKNEIKETISFLKEQKPIDEKKEKITKLFNNFEDIQKKIIKLDIYLKRIEDLQERATLLKRNSRLLKDKDIELLDNVLKRHDNINGWNIIKSEKTKIKEKISLVKEFIINSCSNDLPEMFQNFFCKDDYEYLDKEIVDSWEKVLFSFNSGCVPDADDEHIKNYFEEVENELSYSVKKLIDDNKKLFFESKEPKHFVKTLTILYFFEQESLVANLNTNIDLGGGAFILLNLNKKNSFIKLLELIKKEKNSLLEQYQKHWKEKQSTTQVILFKH